MRDQRREQEEGRRREELSSAFHIPVKKVLTCKGEAEQVEKVEGEEVKSEGEGKEASWKEEQAKMPTVEEEEARLEEELGSLVQEMQGSHWSDGTHI